MRKGKEIIICRYADSLNIQRMTVFEERDVNNCSCPLVCYYECGQCTIRPPANRPTAVFDLEAQLLSSDAEFFQEQ